jgi:UV DNA damage endonuclease
MNLDSSAKIQVHVGGAYGDKNKSIRRFVKRFFKLDSSITNRLVIENDDKLYCLRDCMEISYETGLPVLFDVFHHTLYNGW